MMEAVMQRSIHKRNRTIAVIDCITGKTIELIIENALLTKVVEKDSSQPNLPFIGPGLIDLQINGINGIDFNAPTLTPQDVITATYYLLSKGVTTFLPTVITNSDENICKLVHIIYTACLSDPLVNDCIWGIHLEGPFISPLPGAIGAHDEQYIRAPEWETFQRFQEAAGGKIKLVTIAPEWEGATGFIEKCRAHHMLVSIGHSMANEAQIASAVKAGASLATHVGNAVPLMLPRHPNILFDILAEDALYACIIADGIHIPNAFIKVVMKNKGNHTLLVSDATCFAGMPPGEYQNHIGGTVILDHEKRISLKSTPGMLAGAAKLLPENIAYLINQNLASAGESWKMASTNVVQMLAKSDAAFHNKHDDLVIFQVKENAIQVQTVIKNNRIVFERSL